MKQPCSKVILTVDSSDDPDDLRRSGVEESEALQAEEQQPSWVVSLLTSDSSEREDVEQEEETPATATAREAIFFCDLGMFSFASQEEVVSAAKHYFAAHGSLHLLKHTSSGGGQRIIECNYEGCKFRLIFVKYFCKELQQDMFKLKKSYDKSVVCDHMADHFKLMESARELGSEEKGTCNHYMETKIRGHSRPVLCHHEWHLGPHLQATLIRNVLRTNDTLVDALKISKSSVSSSSGGGGGAVEAQVEAQSQTVSSRRPIGQKISRAKRNPNCNCGYPSLRLVSTTVGNPNRAFYCCALNTGKRNARGYPIRQCQYYVWEDEMNAEKV